MKSKAVTLLNTIGQLLFGLMAFAFLVLALTDNAIAADTTGMDWLIK